MKVRTKYIIIAILAITLAIIICIFTAKKDENQTQNVDVTAEVTNIEAEYDEDDESLEWKNDNVTYIDLNSEQKVEIIKAGTYHLSGTMQGYFTINVGDKESVKLVLENANITSENTAPIYVKNANKVILLVEEGSINTLTDGASYTNLDENEEPDGCLFSKDDLIINGKGTLNINANYEDGIVSKDDLKILNATLNITANDDGIRGKDSLCIKNANITIKSNGDGLKATNDSDTSKGYIVIQGGIYNIETEQDGIQAETILKIEDGTFNITTAGGSINSSSNNMGMWQQKTTTTTDTLSTKGLKGVTQIQISGGTFNIDSSDDSIHSNGVIVIDGGTFEIQSGDDGIHADTNLTINNGTININKSYEGLESAIININNGKINVVASDDRNKCSRRK